MLRSYLRIAYRTLTKNKAFSFINILGLAVGLTAFLFIVHYARFERSYETYNPNADNVYRVTLDLYNGNEYVVTDCETYAPVGPELTEKMPEVIDYVRMYHNDGLQDVEANNQKFLEEGIYFADPSAFDIFSVDVVHGDKNTAFNAPYKVAISITQAKKYFGRTDVLGESIKIRNNVYQITAVMADVPINTHLKFHTLLSHKTLNALYPNWYKDDSWGGNNEYTYLLMAPGTDVANFNEKLVQYAISLKDKIGNERFVAQPIKDIHLYSNKSFEPEVNGNAKVVHFLLAIAVFILVIAWVNYVNLSTAKAIERAREVGIRKVMGSVRFQLILQFISESIIVNVIAGLLAFILFQTGLPLFRELTGQSLPIDYATDTTFWYIFLSLILVGSALSGFYPAFVLSSFNPVAVLKGKFRSSHHGQRMRQGLVVFQFAATVVLMIGMCVVYLQLSHLRSFDLGMNIDQTLAVRAPLLDLPDSIQRIHHQVLKTELLRIPGVKNVAKSESLPGLSLHEISTTSNVKRVGFEKVEGSYNYYFHEVDADYIPTLGMKLVAGRNFQDGVPNDDQVIINEEAVKRLGFSNLEEAIGSKITFKTRWEGEPATIIGVLQNFYQQSPKEQQIPMILTYRETVGYFSIRLNTDEIQQSIASIKATWDKVYPNTLFHYFFINETYDQQYKADARFGKVVATFCLLATFIACLGLFGLSSFTIVQRTKEIGIRKVLGASVLQIVHLLSKEFAKVIFIASIVALPIAYYTADQWLSTYAIRISLGLWMFLIPVISILAIALGTVSIQTIKTALGNPSGALRQE
jgi:putative ABC transport system permease protein